MPFEPHRYCNADLRSPASVVRQVEIETSVASLDSYISSVYCNDRPGDLVSRSDTAQDHSRHDKEYVNDCFDRLTDWMRRRNRRQGFSRKEMSAAANYV